MSNKIKPNILFLIPSLLHGGAESQTIQQCNALYEQEYSVFLCVLTQKVPLLSKLKIPGEHQLLLNLQSHTLHLQSAMFQRQNIRKLNLFIKRHKITHVVANLPLGHWYGRVLKVLNRNIKLYLYHRSMQYAANPLNSIEKRLFNYIQSGFARFTDDISICISEAVRVNIQKHLFLKNPVIIYNSIYDVNSNIASDAFSGSKMGKINLVLPGRLHHSKGQTFFLSVLSEMPAEIRSKINVVLAGGGDLEAEVHQYIKYAGLNETVSITGVLSNTNLLKYINSADLIVIPSIHEGLGNVAIEALMLGKTMIVSTAGGLKEIITDGINGYMFQEGNKENCLKVLTKVIEGLPETFLSEQTLRNDYNTRFSPEAHLKRLTSIL